MPLGGGKYDKELEEVRKLVGLPMGEIATKPMGALLIVIGGKNGSGFSMAADVATTRRLPELLRTVADLIERTGAAEIDIRNAQKRN